MTLFTELVTSEIFELAVKNKKIRNKINHF